MLVRNSIALGTAATAGIVGPALIFGAISSIPPWFGLHGAAAFTTSLCWFGTLIGIPHLFGGLLALLILDVILCLIVYLFMQIQLAWLPV